MVWKIMVFVWTWILLEYIFGRKRTVREAVLLILKK